MNFSQFCILFALLMPVLGALLLLTLRQERKTGTIVSVTCVVLNLIFSICLLAFTWTGDVIAVHIGAWKAPFGIVFAADGLSAMMLVACQIIVLASLIFCHYRLNVQYHRRFLYPLILTLCLGANGAFLTGDLFNLYVWFEVLLLSSFAIMAMMQERKSKRVAWNYIVMNLVSSFLFLMSVGFIYGKTGILNFAKLRETFESIEQSFLIESSATLLFAAFAIKSALIPLAFWLPGSYPKLPAPLAALFGAILTKVGLYAFYRVFGMVFSNGEQFLHQDLLLILANLTMLGGVLGAMAQKEMKAILSFHIISQVGYMAAALALYTPASLAAGVLYLFHHIVAKGNLFFACDLVEQHTGDTRMNTTKGVMTTAPWIAAIFAVSALALAGLPPLSGFFAKFSLLQASVKDEAYFSLIVMALVGVFTLFSMVKIWRGKFWGDPNHVEKVLKPIKRKPALRPLLITSGCLAVLTLCIGMSAQPILEFAQVSIEGLKHPNRYIEVVLHP